jgi:hypothetical protein
MRIFGRRLNDQGMRLLQRLRKVDLLAGRQKAGPSDGSRVYNSQEVGRAVVCSPPPPRLSDGPGIQMKNIFDVIRVKEDELNRLRKDVFCLKEAARMMAEPTDEADQRINKILSEPQIKIQIPEPTIKIPEPTVDTKKTWP